MLIKTHRDGFIHPVASEITPQSVYHERRDMLRWLAGGGAGVALAGWAQRDAEALQLLQEKGVSEESLVPYGTINPNNLSRAALINRGRYRIEIGCRLNSFREMVVASHMRLPFNFSVPVNSGFNNLDAEGVPNNKPGVHNHAVSGGFALKWSAKYGWLIPTRNSWSTKWGLNGYFNTAEKTVQGSAFDAYCVLATITDPQGLPPAIR